MSAETDDPQAPWPLEIVRGFVNSFEIEPGLEYLTSPGDLRKWLSDSGLLSRTDRAGPDEVALARRTREALRALLWANNGDRLDPAATEVLNDVARLAGLTIRFTSSDEVRLEPRTGGVTGAMGRLLAIVADAMKNGTWTRLKACRNEACGWAFYDHARNHSAKWCSMAVCGNRMKARAFRARRSGAHA